MRPSATRMRRRLLTLALGLLTLVLSACATDNPQDFLNPGGEFAEKPDKLWDLTFGIAVVVFFLVEGALVYALIKYRQRPDREASQFHGNTKLEVILTVVPALILAGIAVPTVSTIFDIAEEPTGDNVVRITVKGRQFWWEYIYDDYDFITANEMHIPTNTPVRLTIEGVASDVNHSFWVPRLAGKQDVIPGRVNTMTMEADEPGMYLGQCTEFCGLSHANMRLRVFAHTPADFERWLADQQKPADSPTDAIAKEGESIFMKTCTACHAVDGTDAQGTTAPNLTHFASRTTFAGALFENDTANLRRWIDDPPAVKPGSLMPDYNLTPEQIDAVVAYLQTLE